MSDSQGFKVPECANTTELQPTAHTSEAMEVDEGNQGDDNEFDKLLWSIDDDTLFQPLGLTNHGTDAGKTVFVVWNDEYLLNFVFKRARRTKKINLTKVRLTLPLGEIVNDMFILELNALLLMRSGRVYYFSSVKSMHAVDWLNDAGGGVRCMAAAPSVGFSCIRYVANEKVLTLEMYRDVPDIGRSVPVLLQRCDITFDDKNMFNCSWEDERYTLVSQEITANNLDFMHHVLQDEVKLTRGQWVHIFTVSCIIYALVVACTESNVAENENIADCEYSIHQLCSYATNVDSIQLDCEKQRCLIFLQCGSIDIWYYSNLTCGLRRMQHHTGAQFTHYVYSPRTRCLYFTDEQQVAQLHFMYDAEMDTCVVQETYKAIPGIVACTWVETQQHLICISCNNIFYKINFETPGNVKQSSSHSFSSITVSTEYEKLHMLYELTQSRLSRLLASAEMVNELTQLPARMHAAVEEECVKQQLLAVASNRHLYRFLAKARLVYSTQLPTAAQAGIIMLYANNCYQLHHDSYVALIYLKINKNDALHSGDRLWHLHIDVDCNNSYMLHIPSSLLQQQLCIVLPLKRTEEQLLAEIKLKLYTLVCLDMDFVAITLPIDVEIDSSTYAELFTRFKRFVTICNNYDIGKLINNYLQRNKTATLVAKEVDRNVSNDQISFRNTDIKRLSHTLRLPPACSFSDICACFDIPITEEQSIELYFMYTPIKITYTEEDNYINMESMDAIALYYLKIQLLNSLPALLVINDKTATDGMQQLLMQLQTDLTSSGSAFLRMPTFDENNADDDNTTILYSMQLQQLKQIYAKLRSDFHRLYS